MTEKNSTKILLFLLVNFSIITLNSETIKFGLGSCLDQDYPQPIWDPISKENLNYFVFLGDNVYGDSLFGGLRKMKYAYRKQKSNFPIFLSKTKIFSIWDDHDFGKNDGGYEYKNKDISKEMYLNFWNIPKNDDRHKRGGIYFSREIDFFDNKFKLIFLDTRYFRSELKGSKGNYIKNVDDNATLLGTEQWGWLKNELNKEFDFLIIFSSIQIIAQDHGYEKWSNFPNDRNLLFELIKEYKDKTILVSGDRHRGGIYKKDGFYEITASSLNKPGSSNYEIDKFSFGETFYKENYGLLEISKNNINIALKNISGETINSLNINY